MGFQDNQLCKLAEVVNQLQSFRYQTLAEARSIVAVQNIRFEFDALSLCAYQHNLDHAGWVNFGHYLTDLFEASHDREEQKARVEYGVLFHFMQTAPEYSGMKICKENRPDFILKGTRTVGIEVTELTTPPDRVLHSIARENFGHGMTADRIRELANKKHGQKALDYSYWDLNGGTAIGSPLFDVDKKKQAYAGEIKSKYEKYHKMFNNFDEFIILCNAQHSVSISRKSDSDDVLDIVKTVCPDIRNCTVAILRDSDEDDWPIGKCILDRYNL